MHTFILALSFSRETAQLEALAAGTTERTLPIFSGLDSALRTEREASPVGSALRFAFAGISAVEAPEQLLQTAATASVTVIVFGGVLGVANAADRVLQTYVDQGLEAVRNLDGSFGAVIIDQQRALVWLASDLLGWRSLRFTQQQDLLLVSPHDIVLVASGHVPLDYDLNALASIVIADHSLGGRSLLQAIKPAEAAFAHVWRGAAVERAGRFALTLSERPEARDSEAIVRQQEQVVDALADATRAFTHLNPNITVELTAGLDSRAVFALLSAAAPNAALTTVTSGEESNIEVQVAQRLSTLRQVSHRTRSSIRLEPTAAAAHIEQRAFACNGDTNAKRALNRPPSYQTEAQASGVCGELYRGFYYPYFGLFGRIPDDPEQIAKTLIRYRFRRLPRLKFEAADTKRLFRERFQETLHDLAVHAPSGADLTDLFYLFERCSRWGAKSVRFGKKPLFIPYASTNALRSAFSLPAPVGHNCAVQVAILRR